MTHYTTSERTLLAEVAQAHSALSPSEATLQQRERAALKHTLDTQKRAIKAAIHALGERLTHGTLEGTALKRRRLANKDARVAAGFDVEKD